MTTPDQGSTNPPQEAPPAPGQTGGNGLAIAGLIMAILGLVTCWLLIVGLVLAIIGLVLAIMGSKKAAERNGAGKGVAVAGIVIGIIGIVLGGAFTTCQIACAAAAHKGMQEAGANGAFGAFGEAMKAASQMPKKLDDAAKKAGYSSFAEWQQKDPKAAAAAQQRISEELGKSIQEKMKPLEKKSGDTGGN